MEVNFQLECITEIDSTNEELLRRRTNPNFHGLCILAHNQTAGQGRRGRSWHSIAGNLFLSVGMRFPIGAASPALLPFSAACSLRATIIHFLGENDFLRLKWPNDIYLHGKKLGGMLSQARQSSESMDLVIGIGLNLAGVPPANEISVPATCLRESLEDIPSAKDFALRFLDLWSRDLRHLEQPSYVKSCWEKHALLGPERMQILETGEWVLPIGIDSFGGLVVESTSGEKRTLSSEEVSLRIPPANKK